MHIETLTAFFMWCTVINGGLLLLWSTFFMFAPELVYRTQRAFIPLPRDTIDRTVYGFLAMYKLVFLVFNAVPFLALLIVG